MKSEFARFKDLLARRWLAAAIVFVVGVALLPLVSRFAPSYKGTAEILIVSEAMKDTTLADPDLPAIVTSTEVLSRVINRLHLSTSPTDLAKKIKTKLPTKSSILEITYKDADSDTAVAVTNAVADESALFFHMVAMRGYNDVLSALETRIAESKATITRADRDLQGASAKSGFASSDAALDDLTNQINDLQAQRGQLVASAAADKAVAGALHRQLHDIVPIARGEILDRDVVYQQIQTGIGRDTADLVSERSSFRDSFPGLSALASRVLLENKQAERAAAYAVASGAGQSSTYTQSYLDSERADANVLADTERLKATDEQLADEQTHLRQAAGAGATVGTLRAERDAAVQQYQTLTQRLSAAQGDAAQASSLGTLVVVSRAVKGQSSLLLYLAASLIVILMFAAGAMYLVDALDRRFWGDREIEKVYRRPVLLEVGKQL